MERLSALKGHLARVDAVAFSADGRFVASTGLDGTVRKWNVKDRSLHKTLRMPGAKYVDGTIPNAGYAVAFSADGRCLACGCFNGDVMLWDFLKLQ
jgi:WD40 repeat protein